MTWILDAFQRLAAWWCEGMAAATALPDCDDDDADRAAYELERQRLTLTPWWL